MASAPVRVRFAPAPTGYLHLGSARAALFNWLFARHTGGEFLLRIEDTDAARSSPEFVEVIFDILRWLGLEWDGDAVFQSQRADEHQAAVAHVLGSGSAYLCDCSQDAVRERAAARGGPPGYDGHCRDRGLTGGDGVVVRFRTPSDGETAVDDLVRGRVVFQHANLDDFVIRRSSGEPTFFVANAVDDAAMGITHVVRGEDLLNVTPKVLLLREALGHAARPVFAHLPLIVNVERKKLSKRRDDVSVADYRDRGYLPEAMVNYLATLGWGAADGVEIRPLAEIVEQFDLGDVGSAPAAFDAKKLDHFNGEYVRAMSADEFIERSRPFLPEGSWESGAFDVFRGLAPLVQERIKRLDEVGEMIDFVFLDQPEIRPRSWERVFGRDDATPAAVLADAANAYRECRWDHETLYRITQAVGERHGWKLGKTTGPIRVAVTGSHIGPPLFESLEALGRQRTVDRLDAALAALDQSGGAAGGAPG